jgi:hypothetical protein
MESRIRGSAPPYGRCGIGTVVSVQDLPIYVVKGNTNYSTRPAGIFSARDGRRDLETLDNAGVAHRWSARLTNVIVAAIPESSWDTR